jgi:hypothetical protein
MNPREGKLEARTNKLRQLVEKRNGEE